MKVQLPPVGEITRFFPNHRKCVVRVLKLKFESVYYLK